MPSCMLPLVQMAGKLKVNRNGLWTKSVVTAIEAEFKISASAADLGLL